MRPVRFPIGESNNSPIQEGLEEYRQHLMVERLEKAHDAIDGIIRKTDIKGMLKGLLQEKTNIQDIYSFGKQGKGYFKNNLLDAIINSQTSSNNNFEDLLKLTVGGRFGPKDNWKAEVSGGKGQAGFNIAKLF